MTRNNNAPPIVEERTIEQINEQQIAELREQVRILQNELKEKEWENEELDKLVWERIEKLGNEREEKKSLKEENKKFRLLSLFRKNNIKKLLQKWSADERKVYKLEKENKEKDKEIANLKQELAREKYEKGGVQQELTDLRVKYKLEVRSKGELSFELQEEKGWWDKWMNERRRLFITQNNYYKTEYKLDFANWTPTVISNDPSFGSYDNHKKAVLGIKQRYEYYKKQL